MKRIALLAVVCSAALSGATSRSSFLSVSDLTGVTATPVDANTWDLSLALGGGTFNVGPTTYHITQIFGFWELDTTHSFTRTGASIGGWKWDTSTSDGGNLYGWINANKSEAINPGGTKRFNYTGGTGLFETLGFHVTTVELFPGTTGYTGHITVDGGAPPVPEPVTMGLLAAALGVAARKRMRR